MGGENTSDTPTIDPPTTSVNLRTTQPVVGKVAFETIYAARMKEHDYGNDSRTTYLGAVGGLGAGSILGSLGVDAASGADAAAAATSGGIGTLISGILGGGAGGAALGGIGGIVKNMMSKG